MIHLFFYFFLTIFYYLASCVVVCAVKSANNNRYWPMAGLIFKWNTCPLASYGNVVLFFLFQGILVQEIDEGRPCLSCGENCSGFTSGGKTLLKKQKKKRCVCGAFLYFLDSLSSSSNISCVTQKVLFLLKKHLAVRQTIATAKTTQMAR